MFLVMFRLRWTSVGLLLCVFVAFSNLAYAWSNGGFSSSPSSPKYGTHDWIADHALDWLPNEAKQWIIANRDWYLYGTELPDNGQALYGIGDMQLHYVYYSADGRLVDDAAARRANATFRQALGYMLSGDMAKAAMYAGAMTHYISDVAVFGHVMGAGTDWGAEVHHNDYEDYVNARTSSYQSEFNVFLSFDGELRIISAYDATAELAYDTTFDMSKRGLTCVWMDKHYNWSEPVFRGRAGDSLNHAVNCVADALYTLYTTLRVQSILDYPIVAMPEEHIDYTVSLDGEKVWVNVEGTYFMKKLFGAGEEFYIDGNRYVVVSDELSLVYPTPPGARNISLKIDDNELSWSNYTEFNPQALHTTALGKWPMIYCKIRETPRDFILKISYTHPVEAINGSQIFLYDLNISPYLTPWNPTSEAYFTIRMEVPYEKMEIYTTGEDGVWRPLNYTVTEKNGVELISFQIVSEYLKPLHGDVIVKFTLAERLNQQNTYFLVWAAVIISAAMLMLYVFLIRATKANGNIKC